MYLLGIETDVPEVHLQIEIDEIYVIANKPAFQENLMKHMDFG
jgi:hypothetical protein